MIKCYQTLKLQNIKEHKVMQIYCNKNKPASYMYTINLIYIIFAISVLLSYLPKSHVIWYMDIFYYFR